MLQKEKVCPRPAPPGSHMEGTEGVTGSIHTFSGAVSVERSRAFLKKFKKAWGGGVSVSGATLMNAPPSLLGEEKLTCLSLAS